MARAFKIGIFDTEEKFLSSLKYMKDHGFTIYEVFTPYPLHEVFHLMKRKSKLVLMPYQI